MTPLKSLCVFSKTLCVTSEGFLFQVWDLVPSVRETSDQEERLGTRSL